MKDSLLNLKKEICTFPEENNVTDEDINSFIHNSVVALMAGGAGSRLQVLTDQQNANKNSLKLSTGETMIEMAIELYKQAGIKDFVALVYHRAESIVDLLGDGSKYGVNIKYSYDPEKPVGKGGAVKNALDNGSISRDKNLIVHNPDDVIVNYPGEFVHDIVKGHLAGVERGGCSTVVVVEETPYTYTGMKIVGGVVDTIEMYPLIPIPTHVGITIFSAEVYEYFDRLFNLKEKVDFEKVLFPILSDEKKLHAVSIPNGCWIAVNNPKALNELSAILEREKAA